MIVMPCSVFLHPQILHRKALYAVATLFILEKAKALSKDVIYWLQRSWEVRGRVTTAPSMRAAQQKTLSTVQAQSKT